MIAHILGAQEIDKDLEKLILEKAEGVPFFSEELLKSLKDFEDHREEGQQILVGQ
jgi:predicted ATPase